MRNHKPGRHYRDRIAKFVRTSMESDFALEAGGWMKEYITPKSVLSTCLGLAAGFALGMMIRRRV